jgi:Protein of unknown function (DUF2563)
MFVDTGTVHTGANDSHREGSRADEGANHLARMSPMAGMFGDFAIADACREVVIQAHTHHTAKLRAHQQILSDVGDRARAVATAFTKMEEHNASELKAVRCNSDI